MQEEFYNKLSQILSVERLEAYRRMDHADQCTTLARYLWNMAVCESLYSPLQLFEVGLRNSIHNRLTCLYSENWYDNPSFRLTQWGNKEVCKVKEKIKKQGRTETPGLVVAELQFGFWTHLFEDHYENTTNFMPKSIKYIFPELVKSQHNRKKLKRRLDDIRNFRNKVFHHERIIYWQDLQGKHNSILEVIKWISIELNEMAEALDRFREIYSAGIDPWKSKIRNHWPE